GRAALTSREVCEVRSEARSAQLRPGLKDVIAGDALPLTPAAFGVAAKTRTAHLLRVAGCATEIGVHHLSACGDAGLAGRVRLAFRLVEIGRETTELGM